MKIKLSSVLSAIRMFMLASLIGCSSPASLRANGDLIGSDSDRPIGSRPTYVSDVDNPLITGQVTLNPQSFERPAAREESSCCDRVRVIANSPFALPGEAGANSTAFVQLQRDPVGNHFSANIYEFRVPTLKLAEGSPVRLSLEKNGAVVAMGTVALAPDVIVLPVYVHVFVRPGGPLPEDLQESRVFHWLEEPSLTVRGESVGSTTMPGIRTKMISLEIHPSVTPPDNIWKQARIQFRFAGWERIEQTEGLEGMVLTYTEYDRGLARLSSSTRLTKYVQRASGTPGMHIFIGGYIQRFPDDLPTSRREPFVLGATRGPDTCDDLSPDVDNCIVLSKHAYERSLGSSPYTLAHEIGHFLGLQHVDGDTGRSGCGGLSLDPVDSVLNNLMQESHSSGAILSRRQIEYARQLACSYRRLWGMPTAACP